MSAASPLNCRALPTSRPFTAGACRCSRPSRLASRSLVVVAAAKTVEIEHEGVVHVLSVEDGQTVLEVALKKGLDLPHDCKLGVCMTCPAKLVSGQVQQSGSMLSDDVADKGYALLCMAQPTTDCKIVTIPEDELLELQLCA